MRNLIFEFNDPTVANFNATTGIFSYITARISWGEPEEPNGTISMYEYSIVLESDPSVIVYSESTVGTSVVPYVTVKVYTKYEVIVTARTGGGLGTPISQVEFSPEAGK